MLKKICLIINPFAGRLLGRKINKELVSGLLGYSDFHLWFTEKEGKNSATNLAMRAQEKGFNRIIVAGGDGTIQEVVNGLFLPDSPISLGIVPMGRANDLANALNLPKETEKALKLALFGKEVTTIDLGIVNGKRFVNVFSIGLDARINERAFSASAHLKEMLFWQFLYPFWETPFWLAGGKEVLDGISSTIVDFKGDISRQTSIVQLTVSNVSRYANNFKLTPKAKVNDGLLDICLIRGPISRIEILSLFFHLMNETHINLPKVSILRLTKNLVIKGQESFMAQVDGEPIGPENCFEISTFSRALNVVVSSLDLSTTDNTMNKRENC